MEQAGKQTIETDKEQGSLMANEDGTGLWQPSHEFWQSIFGNLTEDAQEVDGMGMHLLYNQWINREDVRWPN